ncbi:hypothetical protein A8C32_03025 [Flavivirga aquatica]|uniref:Secretion system C-terminal sorting domain-containing protein n=1 Tax=Flavivirga aquatica TaxID=1849968 RepID=A0A1E5TAR9_9FLAO|nr:T9SS type A sorting domain-containing protein [Flavivirga aquatica]OEK08436.1 hypothetical protein A8C32_03025 [Flavivirga aquatica]
MRNNYLKTSILLLITILSTNINAQTTLTAGDIAFVGINTKSDDFAFVFLKNITALTSISFNNKGWKEGGGWFSTSTGRPLRSDKTVIWTADKSYSVGDVIRISRTNSFNGDGSLGTGSVAGDVIVLKTNGDTMYAYQGLEPVDEANVDQFITAINVNGKFNATNSTNNASDGDVPSSLTLGVNCLEISPERDNAVYTGSIKNTAVVLRTLINDATNWDRANGVNLYDLKLKSHGGDIGDGSLGVNNIDTERSIVISPNPVVETLNIKINRADLVKIKLINVTGKLINTYYVDKIDLTNIPSGMYFLSIETDRATVIKKILKL